MRWPWVSRTCLDILESEIAWLRDRNVQLTETVTRIQRREAGMPEVPREPRQVVEPMPKDLYEYLSGFGQLRHQQHREAYRLYAKVRDWDTVKEKMIKVPEPEGAPQ